MSVPCEMWCTADDLGDVPCDDAQVADAIASASYVLWLLSRRKYPGLCSDTVRPYASGERSCLSPFDRLWAFDRSWGFVTVGGCWTCSAHHFEGCTSCGSRRALGRWPVVSIDMVEVDGVVLDPAEYALQGKRWIVRMADVDGNRQHWPHTQRLDLPLGEDGTWAVTFTYGAEVPVPGKLAAIALSKQWCAALIDDEDCALPDNLLTYVRQGVSVTTLDHDVLFVGGRTGIEVADRWLAAERYADKMGGGAAFYNPDDVMHVESIFVPSS